MSKENCLSWVTALEIVNRTQTFCFLVYAGTPGQRWLGLSSQGPACSLPKRGLVTSLRGEFSARLRPSAAHPPSAPWSYVDPPDTSLNSLGGEMLCTSVRNVPLADYPRWDIIWWPQVSSKQQGCRGEPEASVSGLGGWERLAEQALLLAKALERTGWENRHRAPRPHGAQPEGSGHGSHKKDHSEPNYHVPKIADEYWVSF